MGMKLTDYIKALQAVSKVVGPDADYCVYYEDRYVPLSEEQMEALSDKVVRKLESKGCVTVRGTERCIYV